MVVDITHRLLTLAQDKHRTLSILLTAAITLFTSFSTFALDNFYKDKQRMSYLIIVPCVLFPLIIFFVVCYFRLPAREEVEKAIKMFSGFAPLLKRFDRATLENVATYKAHHKRLFAITKDDAVLAAGDNTKGCLGLGHRDPVDTFEELPELRGKGVKEIVCGESHNAALTESGDVWLWGYYRDMTREDVDTGYSVPVLFLEGCKIVSVKCGAQHTMALSRCNELRVWGDNSRYQLALEPEETLLEQQFRFTDLKVYIVAELSEVSLSKIECGPYHCLALSNDGRLFAWGDNTFNQLNLGVKSKLRWKPRHVRFIGERWTRFKAMAAGPRHTVLVATDGQMFELGYEDCSRSLTEATLPDGKVVFDKIYALSFAMVEREHDNDELFIAGDWLYNYYVWDHRDLCDAPTKTSSGFVRNIGAVIDKYSRVWAFPDMLKLSSLEAPGQSTETQVKELKDAPLVEPDEEQLVKSHKKTTLGGQIAELFDQKKMSDFEFRFESADGESKTIRAHKMVLSLASEYLPSKLADSDFMVVDAAHSYDVIYEYVRFLYHGVSEFNYLHQMMSLYRLAVDLGETKLKDYCVNSFVEDFLSIECCCDLYQFAMTEGLPEMETAVVQFMADNLVQLTASQGFNNMEAGMAKELHIKFAEYWREWYEANEDDDDEEESEDDEEDDDEEESDEDTKKTNSHPLINIKVVNKK